MFLIFDECSWDMSSIVVEKRINPFITLFIKFAPLDFLPPYIFLLMILNKNVPILQ